MATARRGLKDPLSDGSQRVVRGPGNQHHPGGTAPKLSPVLAGKNSVNSCWVMG